MLSWLLPGRRSVAHMLIFLGFSGALLWLSDHVSAQPSETDRAALILEQKRLFDFSTPAQFQAWLSVNDGVMGGVSEGGLVMEKENIALFQGNVSLENNGGFASVRTIPLDYALAEYEGLRLRVLGDGKVYKLRVHTDGYFDGVAYQTDFQTQAGLWQTITLPFDTFTPVFRGRTLRDVPPLSPSQVQQLGLMISDKQVGPFTLQLDWIDAYRPVDLTAAGDMADPYQPL